MTTQNDPSTFPKIVAILKLLPANIEGWILLIILVLIIIILCKYIYRDWTSKRIRQPKPHKEDHSH